MKYITEPNSACLLRNRAWILLDWIDFDTGSVAGAETDSEMVLEQAATGPETDHETDSETDPGTGHYTCP